MPAKIRDIYRIIDEFAPFASAVEGDNVGLLCGEIDAAVDCVLTALDATPAVVREAVSVGAQLIVAHHPLLMQPIANLVPDTREKATLCALVRGNTALITAHTNLDIAPGGVNDALAEAMGLVVTETDGFLRLGVMPGTLDSAREHLSRALGAIVRLYGDPNAPAGRFAICSGSGGSEIENAARLGAKVFITGEIKHHRILEARHLGMAVLEAGHAATEICSARLLQKHLQEASHALQYNVRVLAATADPFAP